MTPPSTEDLTVTPAPLSSRDARRLIERLDAELAERYPDPADNHLALDQAEVAEAHGVFLIARLTGEPVGCGALRRIGPGIGEIKRMYVAPASRGYGVGRRLLSELERYGRRLGLNRLVLETGERQPEAIGLYERAGFARIDRFGPYLHSPASVCLGKDLESVAP